LGKFRNLSFSRQIHNHKLSIKNIRVSAFIPTVNDGDFPPIS
jgi:hypothetical protein